MLMLMTTSLQSHCMYLCRNVFPLVPSGFGPRPGLAACGTYLYVFGSRPSSSGGGANVFQRLDVVTGEWAPVPNVQFPLRQDVVAAFAHNSKVYLIGWQVRDFRDKRAYNKVIYAQTLLARLLARTV